MLWVKYRPTKQQSPTLLESPICRQSRLELSKGPELTAIHEIHELNDAFSAYLPGSVTLFPR